MKLPPLVLREGETLDVQRVGSDPARVAFLLTEVGERGVWYCRATFPLALFRDTTVTPEQAASLVREVLDDRMAISKLTRQAQTS